MPLDPSRLKLVAGSVWEEGPGKAGRWSTDHAIIFINEDEDGDDEGTIEIQAEDALPLAKLIAAAPDLLAALKSMIAGIEEYPGWDRQRHAVDAARAAIARAEGETER